MKKEKALEILSKFDKLESAAQGTIDKCKQIVNEKGTLTTDGKVLKVENKTKPQFIPELKQGFVDINYVKIAEKDNKLYLSNDNKNWYEPDGEISCYQLRMALEGKS